ncbi:MULTISPECIES: S-layer glycoprotein N-glycosyltransferase AglJ [Haloprofundus]|uniref:S-layer glycoprotein N-glycosyltransferase AglJ n=1 Tax=Haloprofundus TaxID=1911573 RepID=UPI000E43053B|nr:MULTISPECIES: S-layer glycoprotein N-glycosyltransferase AglJ [Haloprofundus]QCJ48257.1 S-layer glycoprotein N-glycosyltransferase AglJ [Haloprofundus sp. MHR1]
MDRADVCVLLPTYDEAETIGEVVDGYREQGFSDVLVIDGRSTDGTRDIARQHGARVETQSGTGKGQAIREAMEYIDAPYVLMADGDGTNPPNDAAAMLEPLDDGYEHVVGNRFADMRPGAMTGLNKLGNRIVNRAFAYIHGENFADILSGYRAFTRESFERLDLTSDGFGIETEMSVECAKRNVPTAVVPVTYHPRPDGSDTNLRPFRDGSIIFLELYRRAKTNNPLFYFGSVGVLSTLTGLLLTLYVAYEWFVPPRVSHEVIAVSAAAGILFGVQLLIFGVLADMILTFHREQLRKIEELDERTDASAPKRKPRQKR